MANLFETKRLSKIFAYTKGAGLTPEILEKLVEAGYIPVPVKNFNCIRLIEPISDAEISIIFQAAMMAISNEQYNDVKKHFGKNVVNLVLKSLIEKENK